MTKNASRKKAARALASITAMPYAAAARAIDEGREVESCVRAGVDLDEFVTVPERRAWMLNDLPSYRCSGKDGLYNHHMMPISEWGECIFCGGFFQPGFDDDGDSCDEPMGEEEFFESCALNGISYPWARPFRDTLLEGQTPRQWRVAQFRALAAERPLDMADNPWSDE